MDKASRFEISRRVLVGSMLAVGSTALSATVPSPVSAADFGDDSPPAGYGFVHAIGADGVARLVTVERDGVRVPVIAKLP